MPYNNYKSRYHIEYASYFILKMVVLLEIKKLNVFSAP